MCVVPDSCDIIEGEMEEGEIFSREYWINDGRVCLRVMSMSREGRKSSRLIP